MASSSRNRTELLSENGTEKISISSKRLAKDCPKARKGLPKRLQRINGTLARSLHSSVILQGLEYEKYRVYLSKNENAYILSTNLIASNDKQDSLQNCDLPDTGGKQNKDCN